MVQKPNKWVERLEFTSMQQNDDEIDEYLVRLQTKAERCEFNANKEERILEQIIKGLRNSEERRKFVSKQSLTVKIAIESIRTYEATMKDNTHYKDLCETKDGIIHEIAAKNKRRCISCGKNHGKKQDCYVFNKQCRNVKAFIILRTIVSQRHTCDKGENIVLKKKKKESLYKTGKKAHTNFTTSRIRNEKNVSVTYWDETISEMDSETGLLL